MSSTISNAFSLLDVDEIPSPSVSPKISPAVSKVQVKKSWAEMMDDDEEEPDLDFPSLSMTVNALNLLTAWQQKKEEETKKNDEENKKAEQEKIEKQTALDERKKNSKLSKMKTVTMVRDARSFNKEKNVLEYVQKTRVLTVVSEDHFKRTCDLISRLKTHRKDGTTDVKEQLDKIRIINSLLEWCYKPKDKVCFVFCCAKIHLKDGKTLTVEHVDPKTRYFFELEEFGYHPGSI